jgi:hypothetical protein
MTPECRKPDPSGERIGIHRKLSLENRKAVNGLSWAGELDPSTLLAN